MEAFKRMLEQLIAKGRSGRSMRKRSQGGDADDDAPEEVDARGSRWTELLRRLVASITAEENKTKTAARAPNLRS